MAKNKGLSFLKDMKQKINFGNSAFIGENDNLNN